MIAYNKGYYEVITLEDTHKWIVYNMGDYKHRICRFEKHYINEDEMANVVAALLNQEKQVLDLAV